MDLTDMISDWYDVSDPPMDIMVMMTDLSIVIFWDKCENNTNHRSPVLIRL